MHTMLFVAWKSRHRSLETMYQLIQDVFSAEAGYSSTGRLGLNNNAFQMSEYRTGETGTSLLPTRGQATADSGRNRSTAGGCDVFATGQARAAAYQAAYQAAAGGGSGNKGDKDEEGSYSDSSCDIDVDGTETLDLSPATRKLLSPSTLAQVDRHYAPGQKKNTAKRYSTDEHDGDQVRCISLRRSACWTYNAHR